MKNKCTESILEFGFCGSGSRSNCVKNSIDQTKSTTKVLFAQSKEDFIFPQFDPQNYVYVFVSRAEIAAC